MLRALLFNEIVLSIKTRRCHVEYDNSTVVRRGPHHFCHHYRDPQQPTFVSMSGIAYLAGKAKIDNN